MKATYIRFTDNFETEGNSYFKTPSMQKAKKLSGICAFNFDIFGLSDDEIESKAKQYYKNYSYYGNKAVVFEGEFIDNNANGEEFNF